MEKSNFYEKSGPYPLNEIVKVISCDNTFVNKNNIVIVSFENNDKLLKLDNYAKPEKINLNAYNKKINEYMYIYYPKKCVSI